MRSIALLLALGCSATSGNVRKAPSESPPPMPKSAQPDAGPQLDEGPQPGAPVPRDPCGATLCDDEGNCYGADPFNCIR